MKIAVIGSGISGLASAWLLSKSHQVTLFEHSPRLGGHSRTVDARLGEQAVPVDTGFIVYNKKNYPLLTRMFEELNVNVSPASMSFGVSARQGKFEFGTRKLSSLFCHGGLVLQPKYWKFIRDIFYFNQQAKRILEQGTDLTLGQLLDQLGTGEWHRDYYLLAMGAAIWSTPNLSMLDYPAQTFLQFMDNHCLLQTAGQPQWYSPIGGSITYVDKVKQKIEANNGLIQLDANVSSVAMSTDATDHSATITYTQHNEIHTEVFDNVVMAVHSDQAHRILKNIPTQLSDDLASIQYQPNEVILHTDQSFMPQRKGAWSSWVYLDESTSHKKQLSLSYWMNSLQSLPTTTPIIVTLNPAKEPEGVLDRWNAMHPKFDTPAINAQKNIKAVQGANGLWFAGAWLGYGFHEDGLSSAMAIADALNLRPEWADAAVTSNNIQGASQ